MKKLSFICLYSIIIVSCSSAPKGISPADRLNYTPYTISENKTALNGKYVECVTEDKRFHIFHIGNEKISKVRSSWGRAEAGRTNYAYSTKIDLIAEDESWLKLGDSNRLYAKECGAPLIALEETIFNIRRYDGWFSATSYVANNVTYGSNKDGLLTSRAIGDGECKIFKEEVKYGACTFEDAEPDIKTFLAPYRPDSL
tara:strand:- start:88 stop:684 length:597 start_codon:yes stop_codon:yes gene_type:complete